MTARLDRENGSSLTVLIDTREECPLVFRDVGTRSATLKTGDYSCEGAGVDMRDVVAIERKSVGDRAYGNQSKRPRARTSIYPARWRPPNTRGRCRTMDEADGTVSMVACRPKIAGRQLPTAADKAHRRARWPREVRDKGKGIFSRPHTLRYDGKTYQLEIRSSKGKGFWIMVDGGAVVYGTTNAIALANVVKAIDPEVETVRDTRERMLA